MNNESIKWTLKKAQIDAIDIRKKKNPYTGNEEFYAVIKVILIDKFDTFKMAHTSHVRHKGITLMCFREPIFKCLVESEMFSFSGFVSFGYGNTYLVVRKAFDELGFDVETPDSRFYRNDTDNSENEETSCVYCLKHMEDHFGVRPDICELCGYTRPF